MSVAEKIIALLDTMTLASLDTLPPSRRQHFAQLCRHWAEIAEKPREAVASVRLPKEGVLAQLGAGIPRHE